MLLLTGATGTIGTALLDRLIAAGTPVRCLVRDPRRLGDARVRVQIVLGDLADPRSFRHAMRGVETVVHLAASIRDQPGASIEELGGLATWRMVRAAERAGVRRFAFFSAIGASTHNRARFMRTKALAERAIAGSSLRYAVFAPSIVYAPGDPWLRLLSRLALGPAVPLVGSGETIYEPIWAQDVADCVMAVLERDAFDGARHELAGPETLSYAEIVRIALRSHGSRRRLLRVPLGVTRAGLRAVELVGGPTAFATWDEAELMAVPMTSARGSADVRALGVEPRPMAEVLGG